jgi:Holliday junction DNA helicase RuvA
MIGKLTGTIDAIEDNHAIIDVGGVGYLVFCPVSHLQQLRDSAGQVSLFIETHVREDHIHLYGFISVSEKRAFTLLQSVSGVGAKMAMAILSAMDTEQLYNIIAAADTHAFKPVSGVGPKLAARIVGELSDKIGSIASFAAPPTTGSAAQQAASSVTSGITQDAISALASLGYARSDAYQIVMQLQRKHDNLTLDQLIKEGLKSLSTV